MRRRKNEWVFQYSKGNAKPNFLQSTQFVRKIYCQELTLDLILQKVEFYVKRNCLPMINAESKEGGKSYFRSPLWSNPNESRVADMWGPTME